MLSRNNNPDFIYSCPTKLFDMTMHRLAKDRNNSYIADKPDDRLHSNDLGHKMIARMIENSLK